MNPSLSPLEIGVHGGGLQLKLPLRRRNLKDSSICVSKNSSSSGIGRRSATNIAPSKRDMLKMPSTRRIDESSILSYGRTTVDAGVTSKRDTLERSTSRQRQSSFSSSHKSSERREQCCHDSADLADNEASLVNLFPPKRNVPVPSKSSGGSNVAELKEEMKKIQKHRRRRESHQDKKESPSSVVQHGHEVFSEKERRKSSSSRTKKRRSHSANLPSENIVSSVSHQDIEKKFSYQSSPYMSTPVLPPNENSESSKRSEIRIKREKSLRKTVQGKVKRELEASLSNLDLDGSFSKLNQNRSKLEETLNNSEVFHFVIHKRPIDGFEVQSSNDNCDVEPHHHHHHHHHRHHNKSSKISLRKFMKMKYRSEREILKSYMGKDDEDADTWQEDTIEGSHQDSDLDAPKDVIDEKKDELIKSNECKEIPDDEEDDVISLTMHDLFMCEEEYLTADDGDNDGDDEEDGKPHHATISREKQTHPSFTQDKKSHSTNNESQKNNSASLSIKYSSSIEGEGFYSANGGDDSTYSYQRDPHNNPHEPHEHFESQCLSVSLHDLRPELVADATSQMDTKPVKDLDVLDACGRKCKFTGLISKSSSQPCGHGQLLYPDTGDILEGQFVHGAWSDYGRCRYGNGDDYVGYFLGSIKHGHGRMTYQDGRIFDGTYAHGAKVEGKMTYQDGSEYLGQWCRGARHGRGTYTFGNGSVFYGEFKEDTIQGAGALTWPDGSRYLGEWRNGIRHGPGRELSPDGTVCLEGTWNNGVLVRTTTTTSS